MAVDAPPPTDPRTPLPVDASLPGLSSESLLSTLPDPAAGAQPDDLLRQSQDSTALADLMRAGTVPRGQALHESEAANGVHGTVDRILDGSLSSDLAGTSMAQRNEVASEYLADVMERSQATLDQTGQQLDPQTVGMQDTLQTYLSQTYQDGGAAYDRLMEMSPEERDALRNDPSRLGELRETVDPAGVNTNGLVAGANVIEGLPQEQQDLLNERSGAKQDLTEVQGVQHEHPEIGKDPSSQDQGQGQQKGSGIDKVAKGIGGAVNAFSGGQEAGLQQALSQGISI